MKREELERLLALYYEGQTDEGEEERLRQAFLEDANLPSDLQIERDLFLSLHRERKADILVPDNLVNRLEELIDRRVSSVHRRWLKWGSFAASLLLLIGLGIGFAEMQQSPVPQDTFTNPEDARRALHDILTDMSQTWHEGIRQIEASQQDIVAVNHELNKELNPNNL